MTFKELREMTGLNKTQFSEKYHIPYRTIQNWEVEEDSPYHRDCPEYVLELLEFKIKHENKRKSK